MYKLIHHNSMYNYFHIYFPKKGNKLFCVVFCYVGKVSVILSAIKSVADNKVVGNGEKGQISLEIHHTAGGFVKKGYNG